MNSKGDVQRKQKKLHNMSHADITVFWHSKEVVLLEKSWRSIQSTQLHELNWAAGKSYIRVTWITKKDQCSQMYKKLLEITIKDNRVFLIKNFLRVKRKCQLVIKLKANKCYQKFLHYLFFLFHNSSLLFIPIIVLFVAIFLELCQLKGLNIFS